MSSGKFKMFSLREVLLLSSHMMIISSSDVAEEPAVHDSDERGVRSTGQLRPRNRRGLDSNLWGSCVCDVSCTETAEQPPPRNCLDVLAQGNKISGEYVIYVGSHSIPVRVYCDMNTDLGGWMVFQRRSDGSENFYRDWEDYAVGFGNISAEFWVGNTILHLITSKERYVLRIDMADDENNTRYAMYRDFSISSEDDLFKIQLGNYTGTAGNSLHYHEGMSFSTRGADNDKHSTLHCAEHRRAAWWYKGCDSSNLNGQYGSTVENKGVNWDGWKGASYSLPRVEMKIRPYDL